MTEPDAPPLAVREVWKRFGAVDALAGVNLAFAAGEVHAVLGENGAGKSTLMRVLAGALAPDRGAVILNGRPVAFRSPRDARQAGIGMVYQHFTLVGALTVIENLALSLPGQTGWRFDRRAAAEEAQTLAARIGLDLGAPERRVDELPVGARQRLEIIKALAGNPLVTILDEPTAVLTPQEVRQLFEILRRLRAEGRVVIFITHKLREVKEIADRVSVMRRGRVVATAAAADLDEREMAELMVGALLPASAPRAEVPAGAVIALRVAGVTTEAANGGVGLRDVCMEVRAGEILGIAGVDGNGQRELFEVLTAARGPTAGEVRVDGRLLAGDGPAAAVQAGIGAIPPDRHREGLVLAMSVAENYLLNAALLSRFSQRGFLRRQAARGFAADLVARFAVSCAGLEAPVRSLSGGNQQRIVVGRELARGPAVLVTVNPTRGLDVVATAAVADALTAAARQGCAVVLISTDIDEVLELSHRVHVLAGGRLSAALEPPIDAERLGMLMGGAGDRGIEGPGGARA